MKIGELFNISVLNAWNKVARMNMSGRVVYWELHNDTKAMHVDNS